MTDNTETIYLSDLINNFIVSANGFRALGIEASDETYRELMQDFCVSIGLERNVFDHVQLDEYLKTAKELPDAVKQIKAEAEKPELELV